MLFTHRAIQQIFSRVTTKSQVKINAASLNEWQKSLSTPSHILSLFLTRYFMCWIHKSAKTIIDRSCHHCRQRQSLSGVPDFFDRNKILSGYDLSHYQVPHCIRVFFDFVWFVFIHHNFQFYLNYVPTVTFWIFTYHKIWILLIIFCFIWNYWIIYFSTCLEVFWSVVS